MLHRRTSFSPANSLILGFVLLMSSALAIAQHHGGHGGMSGGVPGGSGRPDGVDEKDTLKDFHQVLAMQATSQQIAEFQRMLKSTGDAQGALQAFQQQLPKDGSPVDSSRRDTLDQALEHARNGNRKFQEAFSAEQKSGLKEIVKRLAKSDADLEQEERKLDQSLEAKAGGPEVATLAGTLDKALSDFYDQELAMGREMSIVLANGQDVAFTLPKVKSPASIAGRTVAVTVSGVLSQTASQGGQRTFKLDLVADLSDLQQNITEVLRSQLDSSATCGQRITIRQASLAPSTPASTLLVKLHFERWTCMGSGQIATEIAEGDGSVEIKLTAAVEKNTLKMTATLGRIDASGMLGDALRSGSLGEDLSEKAAKSVLAAARAGSDFKIALPPAVQNSAAIQSARFQDTSVGELSMVIEGQIEISNEQADALATQLNQALSAKRTAGTPPQLTTRPQ